MNDKQPFIKMLSDLRYGTLLDDLTEKMQEVVNACYDTGKRGSLTLTINVVPGKGGEVVISDKIVAKAPEHEAASSVMFVTPEGNLQRSDPRQIDIEGLKTVTSNQPKTFKEVK